MVVRLKQLVAAIAAFFVPPTTPKRVHAIDREVFEANVIVHLRAVCEVGDSRAVALVKRYADVIDVELSSGGDATAAAESLLICEAQDACSRRSTSRPHVTSSRSRLSATSAKTRPPS